MTSTAPHNSLDLPAQRARSLESITRQLRTDLSSGATGAGVRIGLSVGGLCICIAGVLLVLGLLEAARGRLPEEFIFIGFAGAALAWLGVLYRVWEGYRRARRVLRTALLCLGVWILTAGAVGLVGSFAPRAEFLLGAVVFLGLGATTALVTTALWDARRAREVRDAQVRVRVLCTGCGYSLAGLDTTLCPECGHKPTLEALFAAQNAPSTP